MSDASQAVSHAHVAHHEHYDPEGQKIGMWLFLLTEIMLFAALFITYAVYQHTHPHAFAEGSAHLDKLIGGTNTIVLLTSSLTVALAIAALERGQRGRAIGLLALTLAFAALFLVFKSFEWGGKFSHDLYPGSATMATLPPGNQVFYGLYFGMTGLHALHVIIGGIVIVIAMLKVKSGSVSAERPVFLSNAGLYWHLVDLVWIFLFPLFYLLH